MNQDGPGAFAMVDPDIRLGEGAKVYSQTGWGLGRICSLWIRPWAFARLKWQGFQNGPSQTLAMIDRFYCHR